MGSRRGAPRKARPHDTIPVNVSSGITPNGTDKFEVAVQLKNPDDAYGTHMYQLKVMLIRDGSHKIDAGVAVVGAPEVFAGQNPSPEDLAAPGETGECFCRLAVDYKRMQDWQRERPAEYSQ